MSDTARPPAGNGRNALWRIAEKQSSAWLFAAALAFVLGYWIIKPGVEHFISEDAAAKAFQRERDVAETQEFRTYIKDLLRNQTRFIERFTPLANDIEAIRKALHVPATTPRTSPPGRDRQALP